jgi:hypothetical protein
MLHFEAHSFVAWAASEAPDMFALTLTALTQPVIPYAASNVAILLGRL